MIKGGKKEQTRRKISKASKAIRRGKEKKMARTKKKKILRLNKATREAIGKEPNVAFVGKAKEKKLVEKFSEDVTAFNRSR